MGVSPEKYQDEDCAGLSGVAPHHHLHSLLSSTRHSHRGPRCLATATCCLASAICWMASSSCCLATAVRWMASCSRLETPSVSSASELYSKFRTNYDQVAKIFCSIFSVNFRKIKKMKCIWCQSVHFLFPSFSFSRLIYFRNKPICARK